MQTSVLDAFSMASQSRVAVQSTVPHFELLSQGWLERLLPSLVFFFSAVTESNEIVSSKINVEERLF